jgi:hypothetical protein
MTDKQTIYYELLVLRCQKGHKEAFEELIRSWEQRLFYYIRRLIDNISQSCEQPRACRAGSTVLQETRQ